jgi:hypothetical protein
MKLAINDTITWSSAAGQLVGKITNIVLSENAAGDTVPWLDVKIEGKNSVRLCGIDMNLKMLKVSLFKNNNKMVEKTNLMTGKKYMEEEATPLFLSPASETYWSM